MSDVSNPVKHGDFGDTIKNPGRKVSYGGGTESNEAHNWGANPEHTETGHPAKGDTFSKK
jgi:hypothetical protein